MQKYEELKFNLPEIKGISKKSVDEHLKLYSGYVKNANLIREKVNEYGKDPVGNAYVLGELVRRFSFEWNGMRNHEYYFLTLSDGASALPADSILKKAIEKEWGSFETWLSIFKMIATTRGIGWAMLYWDKEYKQLTHAWIDEQHIGQLNSAALVLGLDMWEHAFYMDYGTEKKKYIDAFFENINWEQVEKFFVAASK